MIMQTKQSIQPPCTTHETLANVHAHSAGDMLVGRARTRLGSIVKSVSDLRWTPAASAGAALKQPDELWRNIPFLRNSERVSKRGSAGSGGFRRGSGTGKKKKKRESLGCHSVVCGTRARFRKRAPMVDDVDAGAEGAQLAPIMWRRLRTRKQSKPFRVLAIGKRNSYN